MRENQKIYIKGDPIRGREVIRILQNLGECKYIKLIQQNYIIIILSIFVASAPFIGALIGKYSVKNYY